MVNLNSDEWGWAVLVIGVVLVIRAAAMSAPRSAAADYRFSSFVNSTGTLTFETVPGLNFQVRSVLRTDLSRSAFPVLCAIEASVTLPLAGSTDSTQTPLPAIRWERASCG